MIESFFVSVSFEPTFVSMQDLVDISDEIREYFHVCFPTAIFWGLGMKPRLIGNCFCNWRSRFQAEGTSEYYYLTYYVYTLNSVVSGGSTSLRLCMLNDIYYVAMVPVRMRLQVAGFPFRALFPSLRVRFLVP